MDEKDTMSTRYDSESRGEMHDYRRIKEYRETFRHPSRKVLRNYLFFGFSLLFVVIYILPRITGFARNNHKLWAHPIAESNASSLVPLEAHIMSKCPDAKVCLVDLVVPAMEKIADKVDFRLSYIGSITQDDNVQCMHGPTECLGNMIELCAAELFPKDVKRSLGFSTCLTQSYKEIPSRNLVEHCALEHGISFDDVNDCISEEGKALDLLKASFKRSQAAGVTTSCTVRLDNKIWCVRDGGQWKECPNGSEVKDLVHAVNKRYEGS